MKEAAGEANLTVIAIILIGVIAAIATPLVNSYMKQVGKQGCCQNYGGLWRNGSCYETDATTGKITTTQIGEAKYWDSKSSNCVSN